VDWNTMFSSFGPHSGIIKLLSEEVPRGVLYGAIIEDMRGTTYFGTAIWDGTRMHTLEGFATAAEAEEAATDLIGLICELQCGHHHVYVPDGLPSAHALSCMPSILHAGGIGCEAVHQQLERRQRQEGEEMAREGVEMQLSALLDSSPLTLHMQAHDSSHLSCMPVRLPMLSPLPRHAIQLALTALSPLCSLSPAQHG
jgi:hypothetical protein